MTHYFWDLKIENLDNREISKLVDFIERVEPKNSGEYFLKRKLLEKIYEASRSLEDFEFTDKPQD